MKMGFLWRRRSSLVKIVVLLSAVWFTVAFLIYSEDRRPANVPAQQPHSLELKFGSVFDDVDDVDDANANGVNAELNNVNANNRANPNRNSFIDSVNSNNNNMDNDSDNDNNNINYMDNSIEQSLRHKHGNDGKANKFNADANHNANHVNRAHGQQRNESAGTGDNANVNTSNNRMRNKFGKPATDDNSKNVPNKNKKLDALRRNGESKGAAAADDDGKFV